MRLNPRIDRPIRIDGQQLEDVNEFTYLGSKVTREGGTSEDIKCRLQEARSAFLSLNQVWKPSLYNVKTKLKIFNSNVKSVLMYESECWKMTVADIKKCEAFNNGCIRREKEGDLTQSYDKTPYTNRKFENQRTTHKRHKNFDNTTIADRLRTVSWSNKSSNWCG